MTTAISVSELTFAIKKALEARFSPVAVRGEVSNCKEQASGHLYFSLKDSSAQLSCVLFRGNQKELTRPLNNGDQVILHGEINVYPPRGAYQLIVRSLEYIGVGQLLLKFQALKHKLESLGWFDAKHKKPLPPFPKRIGVVTSPTGAVIQDIVQVLTRRCPGIQLLLNPVKVQGEGAAQEIARAIDDFNRFSLVDVLIVGRGGGSLEDLWAFNEESVASAIFHSTIPIISAVGHETDFSLADFVADVRAPTPSAAAEIATQETQQQIKFLNSIAQRMTHTVGTLVRHHRQQCQSVQRHPFLSSPYALLGSAIQRLDDFSMDLSNVMHHLLAHRQLQLETSQKHLERSKPSAQCAALKTQLEQYQNTLDILMKERVLVCKKIFNPSAFQTRIDHRLQEHLRLYRERLSQRVGHLQGIDPKNLLKKGYCIPFYENTHSVILSCQELQAQDRLQLMFHDGRANLIVEKSP